MQPHLSSRAPALAALTLLAAVRGSDAHALESRLGGSVQADLSMGLVSRIPRVGAHVGASYLLTGQRNGLLVDLSLQQYTAYGVWERFPALGLSWSHAWGEGPVHAYHDLGAGVAATGLMSTALAPALPMGHLEGGAEWVHPRLWMRLGLSALLVVPGPVLGAGPRFTAGVRF